MTTERTPSGIGVMGLVRMERETGFEPATSTLARSRSTPELLPLTRFYCTTEAAFRSSGAALQGCGLFAVNPIAALEGCATQSWPPHEPQWRGLRPLRPNLPQF